MLRVLLATAAIALVSTASGQEVSADFQKYSVSTAYHGKVRFPDFSGRDRSYKMFRTRINDGLRRGVNFAGGYAIVEIGCGAGCLSPVMAEVSTGKLLPFPLGGEDNTALTMKYRADSRLLVAQWQTDDSCVRQNLVWNGADFDRAAPVKVGPREACYTPPQ